MALVSMLPEFGSTDVSSALANKWIDCAVLEKVKNEPSDQEYYRYGF